MKLNFNSSYRALKQENRLTKNVSILQKSFWGEEEGSPKTERRKSQDGVVERKSIRV
jgi:hypothetical protein